MLAATALVLLMTLPGVALFYGGLVRVKNLLNVFMQCVLAAGAIGLLWTSATAWPSAAAAAPSSAIWPRRGSRAAPASAAHGFGSQAVHETA